MIHSTSSSFLKLVTAQKAQIHASCTYELYICLCTLGYYARHVPKINSGCFQCTSCESPLPHPCCIEFSHDQKLISAKVCVKTEAKLRPNGTKGHRYSYVMEKMRENNSRPQLVSYSIGHYGRFSINPPLQRLAHHGITDLPFSACDGPRRSKSSCPM